MFATAITFTPRFGVVDVEYYRSASAGGRSSPVQAEYKLVHTEASLNTLEMQDIPAITVVAHRRQRSHDDNTWATPLYFSTLRFRCRCVDPGVHRIRPVTTSSVLMGTVSANEKHWRRLKQVNGALGICGAPEDA